MFLQLTATQIVNESIFLYKCWRLWRPYQRLYFAWVPCDTSMSASTRALFLRTYAPHESLVVHWSVTFTCNAERETHCVRFC